MIISLKCLAEYIAEKVWNQLACQIKIKYVNILLTYSYLA